MEFENIKLIKEANMATIVLNREEVMNAIHGETVKELWLAMDEIEQDDDIRVIIFTGSGEKAFAAGADINQLAKRKPMDAFVTESMTNLYRRIETSKKATIAAINGYALGGGLELTLACDIRIASENAKLGLPELNLAIIPGAGGTQRLTRIVGQGIALDLILTGDFLTATDAKAVGLVTKVVPQSELLNEAKEKATKISKKGPLAVQLAKLAVQRGADLDMDTGLLVETLAQAVLYGTEDKIEGTQAFIEKRMAVFSGQ